MLTHKPRLEPLNIGEAKILVEIELDKSFPKQIALDDKLGHKAKKCLLKEDKIPPTNGKRSEYKDMVIPVVAIDTFSDNADSDVQHNCVTPKPGESLSDIYISPATTKPMSLQVAIPQKDSSATFGQHDKDKQQQKPTTKPVKGKAVLATVDTTPMANRFAILNDDVA
ncbi:hypothetical protein F2Q70_00021438 [Brassica cretica]|uniref:Uncharacterized protein n=2 Tax=Brassica cretica TaxID=69181 RepID=A0A3N6SFT6_BRACR|nr:hypothetical protein F2Q70_00021438 [Brassica cretica]KAF2556454.1 hypothetical protein F2Q68_00014989 [Brassica cretica]KAF3610300.1 hypothetical protein DY000_02047731 [Brassica cretica]